MLSRAFFLPGDTPPMTHLGCTLFRHCFHSAWRYARYHLGLTPPASAPIAFVHLRPYFEGTLTDPMENLLLDPGGEEPVRLLPIRLRAAMAFHRLRLARRRDGPTGDDPRPDSQPWPEVSATVSAAVARLGDALLRDLSAVRRRRSRRAKGETVPACSSPRSVSWAETAECPAIDLTGVQALTGVLAEALPSPDPPRGAFRDAWVETVANVRPKVLRLAESSVDCGLLAQPDDALFLPFDHLDVLAGTDAPLWLTPAVASNRAEWGALRDSEAPAEQLKTRNVGLRLRRARAQEMPAAFRPLE